MQATRLFSPSLFKGLTVTTSVRASSQRFFSITHTCQNEETPKTPEATVEEETVEEEQAEPIKLSRRRRRFHEWAHGNGAKYSRPAKGTTNYLGSSTVCLFYLSMSQMNVRINTSSSPCSLSPTTLYSNLDLLFLTSVVKKSTMLLNLIPRIGQFVS